MSARSCRPRHRQHVLGDGERRSGRAANASAASRARIRRRGSSRPVATRRACPTKSRRCPGVVDVVPNDDKANGVSPPHPDSGFSGGSVRPSDRARTDGPDGVDAARADRLRGVVQLLHHPDDERAEPEPDDRRHPPGGRPRRRGGLQGDRHHRRASRLVRTGPARRDRRCSPSEFSSRRLPGSSDSSVTRVDGVPRISRFSASARSSRWTFHPDLVDLVAPHFHLPAAACLEPHPAVDAAAVHDRAVLRPLVDTTSATRVPHAAIGSDVIVGFPGETDDDFADARRAISSGRR